MLTTHNHPSFQTPIDNQIDGITVNADELIIDLLAADRPLLQIAMTHKLTLSQLTVWYAQPAVRALLDALDELATRRAESTAIHARHAAIVVLKEQAVSLCETPRALELAGKAARTLVRLSKASTPSAPRPPETANHAPPVNDPPDPTPRQSPERRKQREPVNHAPHRIPVYPFKPATSQPKNSS